MDLKLLDAEPSHRERAAVDAVLGPPDSGWHGREWDADLEGHVGYGGAHQAAANRHLLLPALHGIQSEIGWISQGALNYVCRRLTVPPAEAYGVATFYTMFAMEDRAPRVAHVCDDVACRPAGAEDVIAALEDRLGPAGGGDNVTWVRSPCLGHCERAPAVLLQLAGDDDVTLAPASADAVESALTGTGIVADIPVMVSAPQTVTSRRAGLRLLARVGAADPESFDDYRAAGGYAALRTATEIGPAAVIREIKDSRLLGRGGAAFPMGVKWEAVASAPARPHYVVCNADESEPGTFKDRVLMEEDPFAVVEAMTIAGYAVGAERGYLYIRGEYPLAAARIDNAIAVARARNYLGPDVAGEGFAFDIEVRRGAGAYICGEETALFNSIEGFRGEPRNKPPFPTQAGLFGKPTVVNNVETLAAVLQVLTDGGPAFAATGTEGSSGTKLFCVSGAVAGPGLYEVPFGTTLGELIAEAGGATGEVRAVLLGGAAGSFVGPDRLDLPLTFEDTRAAGVSLGSGVVVVYGEDTDMHAIVLRIAAFFRDESCGQCVPCRVGTVRQEEALRRFDGGNGDVKLIDEIAAVMKDASICGLGHTASGAVQSAIALGLFGGGG